MNNKTVVIGFGNALQSDDGVGCYIAARLQSFSLPANIKVVDGGLDALTVVNKYRSAGKMIVVDAVLGSGKPGDIYCLGLEELSTAARPSGFSLHDLTPLDVLVWARENNLLPSVTIYGIHPATLDFGQQLSPAVLTAAERLIRHILAEIGVTGEEGRNAD